MAAQAYKDTQHRVPPMNRRPERRSLDKKEKVVTMQMRRAESRRDMYSVDSPLFVAKVLLIACVGGRCAPRDAW
jgi:hypothetical protein